MPTDYQVTAYGHCYQALVTARLIKKNIKAEDLDTCFNYLKLLSADIFLHTKGDALYTAMDYRAFRASYKENYIIEDALIHKMENDDYPILTLEQERAGFEYEYLYYFFLGMHIANEDTLEAVGLLCDDIQVRQNAFVLIFAVHHSHRRELLNLIRGRLADAFKNTRPAELSVDETKFMEKLVAELPTSILSISSTADNRRKQRRGQEAALEAESAESDKAASSPNTHEGEGPDLGQIYRGLRSIEVLGQIVRNRAGSYERREVAEILENTVDLGLRILAVLLRDLRDPEFQASLAELLREAERGREESGRDVLREAEKRDFVEKNIQWAAYVITVGMLNRISGAVGSEKLMGVLSDAANRRATPAYELVDFLVSLSQSGIDQRATKGLMTRYEKTKNYWAAKTLSYYVQMWLNTHAIQDRIRQSILSTLGIKYLPRSS